MHNIKYVAWGENLEVRLQPMDKSVFGPYKHYWNEQVMLFCNPSRTVALSRSRDLARYSLHHGTKQPHQPTWKQDSVPLASIPSYPRLFPTKHLLPALKHTVRTLKSPMLWHWLRHQLLLFCRRRLGNSSCAWYIWQSCAHPYMLSSG